MKKYLLILFTILILGGAGCINKSTVSKTVVFSDPRANFTFEYPEHWALSSVQVFPEHRKLSSDQLAGDIENEISVIIEHDENAHSCSESDNGRLDSYGREIHPIIKSYILNDGKTTIESSVCGQTAILMWKSTPSSTSTSMRSEALYNSIWIGLQDEKNYSITTQEFIDQIERIVKSIRIK